MLKGELALEDFLPDAAVDPRLEATRRKVCVSIDPDVRYTVSLDEPTTVIVKTGNGKEYVQEKLSALGSPEDPLTRAQFSELYRHYTKGGLSEGDIEKTMEMIWNLENLPDISDLMNILTFRA